MRIVIDALPPTLNEVINISKRHWALYSKMKAEWKEIVRLSSLRAKHISNPVKVTYTFILPNNRRRDLDNFYIKGLQDGFWFLPDDNCAIIQEIVIKYKVEKNIRRTIIDIDELILCQENHGLMEETASVTSAKPEENISGDITPSTKIASLEKTVSGPRTIQSESPKPTIRRTFSARKPLLRGTAKTSGKKLGTKGNKPSSKNMGPMPTPYWVKRVQK
jgi:hypothetical protein